MTPTFRLYASHTQGLAGARTIKHCIGVFLILLASLLTTACGILIEAPLQRPVYQADYPADFEEFLTQNNAHREYDDLLYFLATHGVHNIVPVWQLLQQGSDWRSHSLPRFAIPPRDQWDDMINTLAFLKFDLIPYIGPVRVLSGFRTPRYNKLAGGANKSRHLQFSALDLRPTTKIERSQLHDILHSQWSSLGKKYNLGLGLYKSTRFHIDTGGFRQWSSG